MADYSEDAQSAADDIEEAGVAIKFMNSVRGNGAFPWRKGTVSETEADTFGVFLPISAATSGKSFGYRPNTIVPEATELVYVSGIVGTIDSFSYITREGGDVFTILSYDVIAPNGQPILYIIQVSS